MPFKKSTRKFPAQAKAILKPVGPRYYFAYGSNLWEDGMMKRCPDARKIKSLQLHGCRLVFRGVADVEITNDDRDWVEGGLWRISTYDEGRLDSYEGVSLRDPAHGLYRKLTFPIGNTKDDTVWDCLIYKMNRTGIMPPSEHYFNIIKKGYEDFGLNLDKLNEALAASWDDKDRTPQLNARYDRNGRPPLKVKPEPEMDTQAVVAEVQHEADALEESKRFNDLDSVPETDEVTEHFVPPDQWVEGASKECQPPSIGKHSTGRKASTAPAKKATEPKPEPVIAHKAQE